MTTNLSKRFALYSHRVPEPKPRVTLEPISAVDRLRCCLSKAGDDQQPVDACVAGWLTDSLPPMRCSAAEYDEKSFKAYRRMVWKHVVPAAEKASEEKIQHCAELHATPAPLFFSGFAKCVQSSSSSSSSEPESESDA